MPKTMQEIETALAGELNLELVKYLTQGPAAGAPYLEGWRVIEIANDVFGYGGWSFEVQDVRPVSLFTATRGRDRREVEMEIFMAKVRVTAHGVTREDVGIGAGGPNAQEKEMAIKGAVTDGLKRAFRQFGNRFGNQLADKEEGYLYSEGGENGDAAPAQAPPARQPSQPSQPAPAAPQGRAEQPVEQAGDGMATPAQMEDPFSLWPPTTVAAWCQFGRAWLKSNDYSDADLFRVCAEFWGVECDSPETFATNVGRNKGRIALIRWTSQEWDIPDGVASDQWKQDPMPDIANVRPQQQAAGSR